jgi:hypothetical protein
VHSRENGRRICEASEVRVPWLGCVWPGGLPEDIIGQAVVYTLEGLCIA